MANMNPATTIIAKLGGPTMVSRVVGVHRTRVSNWQRPRAKGGTNGLIPQGYHLQLIDYAASQGIPLGAEDFLPIRPSEQIDASAPAEDAENAASDSEHAA